MDKWRNTLLLAVSAAAWGQEAPWRDESLPEETRVEDLLGRLTLEPDAFSFCDVTLPGWKVDPGRYVIEIGRDSRHIVLTETADVK